MVTEVGDNVTEVRMMKGHRRRVKEEVVKEAARNRVTGVCVMESHEGRSEVVYYRAGKLKWKKRGQEGR